MFGVRVSLPPGKAAAHEIFKGFQAFEPREKELVAEILAKIAPGLAAQGGQAEALPMTKILTTLKAAFGAAWTGILKPKKLAADLVAALETEAEGAELRRFCAAVSARCAKEVQAAAALPAQGEKTP